MPDELTPELLAMLGPDDRGRALRLLELMDIYKGRPFAGAYQKELDTLCKLAEARLGLAERTGERDRTLERAEFAEDERDDLRARALRLREELDKCSATLARRDAMITYLQAELDDLRAKLDAQHAPSSAFCICAACTARREADHQRDLAIKATHTDTCPCALCQGWRP